MRYLAILIIAVVVAGCAQKAAGPTPAEIEAAEAKCRGGATSVARTQCFNAEEARLYASHPYQDLLQLRLSYRMALADRIDRGILRQSEADALGAEMAVRIDNEVRRRNAQAQQARRARNYENMLLGLAIWSASRPPQRPGVITCHGDAFFVQCF